MPVPLYMNHNVPQAITEGLRLRGVMVIGRCIRDLELIAKASEPRDLRDQVLYLPL